MIRGMVRAVADRESRSVGESLAIIMANVVAVPVVLGLVALGGVVLAGHSLRGAADKMFSSRNGRPRRKSKPRRPGHSRRSAAGSAEA